MSQQQKYNLIYAGAILSGFEESQVKRSFVEKMKVPQEKVGRLFSGRRIVLRKSLSKQKAESWQRKLLIIGAEAVIIPVVNIEESSQRNLTTEPVIAESKIWNNQVDKSENHQELSNNMIEKAVIDEELNNKINQAKALIAAQQMEQKLNQSKEVNPIKRLVVFSGILIVATIFFYFYVDSIF